MPEQRIDASLECADHRADAMPLEQPAPAAGIPLAARVAHHLVELMRAAHHDQPAELAEFARADVRRDHVQQTTGVTQPQPV